jgi:DNA-binding transcriptional MerR regulator
VDDLVTIGTFSMLSGLSVVALRHYDEVGLLKPASVDPQSGYRRYSRKQLEHAWLISELRSVDLPLDEVRQMIHLDAAGRRSVLLAHRHRLRDRERGVEAMVASTQKLLDREAGEMTTAQDVRLVAVNIGVRSKDELALAAQFWESVLEVQLEDWGGQGVSRQARVGREDHAFFFNLRVRGEDEPHHGHRAAFGIAVADLDETRERALAAGALEHYPPTDAEDQPRHCLLEDPIGNRAVVWQG